MPVDRVLGELLAPVVPLGGLPVAPLGGLPVAPLRGLPPPPGGLCLIRIAALSVARGHLR